MPAWSILDVEERWALVHYIKTFSENFTKEQPPQSISIPDAPEVTAEVLAEGRQFYMDAGCNACHGDEGKGNGPSAADLKDDWGNPIRPFDFTGTKPMKSGPSPQDVYRTVMTGLTGTPMPSFGEVLEPGQAWAVVSYVRSLRPPEQPAQTPAGDGQDLASLPPETLWADIARAASNPMASSPELLDRGKALYGSVCAICHGEKGDGNGPAAAVLVPKPRDFIPAKYKFRTTPGGALPTDPDILRTITMGVPGTSMPSWASLKIEDRWALVHYIKTLSENFTKEKPPPPISIPEPPEVTPDVLAEGRQFYVDAGCNACHGEEGKGNGPSAADLKDDWDNPIRPFDFTGTTPMKSGPSPQDAYRTVMTGLTGTPMPSFGEVLEPAQAWAVVSYVRSLRPGWKPEQPKPKPAAADVPGSAGSE
jgi:cytochrome c oxidase cbb3-type subunit 2